MISRQNDELTDCLLPPGIMVTLQSPDVIDGETGDTRVEAERAGGRSQPLAKHFGRFANVWSGNDKQDIEVAFDTIHAGGRTAKQAETCDFWQGSGSLPDGVQNILKTLRLGFEQSFDCWRKIVIAVKSVQPGRPCALGHHEPKLLQRQQTEADAAFGSARAVNDLRCGQGAAVAGELPQYHDIRIHPEHSVQGIAKSALELQPRHGDPISAQVI
ncbi:hypothetical protein ASE36_02760 [Rhizobium sp. Root274]|nr:hypothetical protein ASE36_02760 [Rhizobium sp. Root274]